MSGQLTAVSYQLPYARCHSERSEESPQSRANFSKQTAGILRFAQNDSSRRGNAIENAFDAYDPLRKGSKGRHCTRSSMVEDRGKKKKPTAICLLPWAERESGTIVL
jgi:hypothetical protein